MINDLYNELYQVSAKTCIQNLNEGIFDSVYDELGKQFQRVRFALAKSNKVDSNAGSHKQKARVMRIQHAFKKAIEAIKKIENDYDQDYFKLSDPKYQQKREKYYGISEALNALCVEIENDEL